MLEIRHKLFYLVLLCTNCPALPKLADPQQKVRHTTKLSQYESRDGNIHLTPNQRQPPQKKEVCSVLCPLFSKKTTKIAKSFKNLGPIIAPPNLLLSKKKNIQKKTNL